MLVRGLAMWMPLVAIPWLAVELGATAAEIGLITGAFYLPTLFVGPLGGVMADRVDRRNVLVGAQLFAAALAGLVAILVVLDLQTLPIVGAASFGLGLVIALEVPVRQAYMTELVPVADISSAASLHATAWNTTRFVGPVVAGVMIAAIGPRRRSSSPASLRWSSRSRSCGWTATGSRAGSGSTGLTPSWPTCAPGPPSPSASRSCAGACCSSWRAACSRRPPSPRWPPSTRAMSWAWARRATAPSWARPAPGHSRRRCW